MKFSDHLGAESIEYENRIVVFVDFLGWKNLIAEAGNDTSKLGTLRSLLMSFAIFKSPEFLLNNQGAQISTFSDNIVISLPLTNDSLRRTLEGAAKMQLGIAILGHALRGAIVVGKIYHDSEVVFGPALIHAYQLESTVASVPRIVLDEASFESDYVRPNFVSSEEGIKYLNPFTVNFASMAFSQIDMNSRAVNVFNTAIGGNPLAPSLNNGVTPELLLQAILMQLDQQLRQPLGEKEWQKLAWLFDLVAKELEFPYRATDLPRLVLSSS